MVDVSMHSSDTKARRILYLLLISTLASLSYGCSSLSREFSGSEREEIKPFAQKTVDVLVVENIQIRDDELVHLRRYVDDSFVKLDELQSHIRRVRQYRQKLVEYSIELVRLSEEYSSETDRVEAYANHLEEMVGLPELNQIGFSEAEWADILTQVRNQDSFLDALRSFQPVITAATVDFAALISRIETELLPATRKEFDLRIESNFREVNQLRLILYNKRKEILAALIAVELYRGGDRSTIAEFKRSNPNWSDDFASDEPDDDQLAEIESDLRQRIGYSTSLIAEIDTDFAVYEKTRSELDRKELEVLEDLTIARLQIETWTQAHHALSKGVKKPGELMQLTVKAAKHYLIP